MTPAHPLSRPFERQMRAFSKHFRRAVEGEVEPLHQCRVATRRLREILPLCVSEVPRGAATRARRRLRRVGRALGGVREIDVALGLVVELAQKDSVAPLAAGRLRQHLRDDRDERRERMLERLRAVSIRKLERDLADIARGLSMRQQTDAWAQTLAVRMARRAQRVREAVAAAGPLYISDRVHAVRIAAKKLRYALELAADTGEASTKGAVRKVRDIQEALGRLHDFEVLATTIQDITVPGADVETWNGALDGLRLELDRECRGLHSQYVAKRESLVEICDMAVQVAVRIWTDRGGELASGGLVRPGGRILKMTLPDRRLADRKASSNS